MGILTCPDCSRDVSSEAIACPACGRPIKAVTIEQTGKTWKIIEAVGTTITILGLGVVVWSIYLMISRGDLERDTGGVSAFIVALFFSLLGLAIVSVGKVGAWWHHG